jgi:hypothetical protein
LQLFEGMSGRSDGRVHVIEQSRVAARTA